MDLVTMIQERLRGLFPEVLGMRFLEATPERVTASLTVRPDLCTAGKVLHGGAIMAFADTLGAVATVLNLPPDGHTTTIESKTNFLSRAPLGAEVIGECTPLHRGRRTMVWQTRLTIGGKLVAVVIQTQMVLEASARN